MKIAVPWPAFILCRHIPHRALDRLKLDLKREKAEGDRGDGGFNPWLLLVVLHWSFGLSGGGTISTVRERRLGLGADGACPRGVDGLEKNPNLDPTLGLGFELLDSRFDLGSSS